MATITIQRKAGVFTDRLRKYKVVVDGQNVGKVADGESVSAEVKPGTHDVQLKIDWTRSPVVRVEASSEQEVRLHCEPAANPLTIWYYATVGSNRYIKLGHPIMTSDTDGPKENKNLKWAMGGVAAVAVLATIVAAVLLFGGGDSGAPKGSDNGSGQETAPVASAKDTGPIAVITDDPSCTAWTAINGQLANGGQGLWNDRDRSVPASAWTPKQRAQFIAAGQSMRGAAAQTVGLIKLTPHRVMRELYQQFIAYARAYSERIPKYTPADNNLAGAANSASSALGAICAAIIDGSAAARGPMVSPSPPPSDIAAVGNLANPQPMLTSDNSVCPDWKSALDEFGKQTAAWQQLDPNVPSIYWNKEQKAVNYAVGPVMNSFAGKLEQLGRQSDNAVWQDLANLSAQYRRAFVTALPTYTPTDNHLANAANFVSTTVLGACVAVAE